MKIFRFPVDVSGGSWQHWRIRWVPLVMWVLVINLLLMLLISIPRKDRMVQESGPVNEVRE